MEKWVCYACGCTTHTPHICKLIILVYGGAAATANKRQACTKVVSVIDDDENVCDNGKNSHGGGGVPSALFANCVRFFCTAESTRQWYLIALEHARLRRYVIYVVQFTFKRRANICAVHEIKTNHWKDFLDNLYARWTFSHIYCTSKISHSLMMRCDDVIFAIWGSCKSPREKSESWSRNCWIQIQTVKR